MPGLPGPANMSWGTELWVSLLSSLSIYLCLRCSRPVAIYAHAYHGARLNERTGDRVVCPSNGWLRCFRQRVTTISPRKPVHGGKPLTGVLPLRLLAAGDVLLSFGISPLLPFPARVYVYSYYSSLCAPSLASFLMKSSTNAGATV